MLKKIAISHFRTLGTQEPLQMTLGHYNLVVGANGSGKTSLLEAIFLLANGKSFREHRPKHYIHHSATDCTVFAQLSNGDELAIKKDKDKNTLLRHNGQTPRNQTALARNLPTLILDPIATGLLDEGSEARRGLLDWLCFYSDERFYGQWRGYRTLLKQRNKALKDLQKNPSALNRQAISAWDNALSEYATHLHQIRQTAFDDWRHQIKQMTTLLLPQRADLLSVHYQAGFDTQTPLQHTLAKKQHSDVLAGHTTVGAHRADVNVFINQQQKSTPVAHTLSRGEKKLLIIALKLAQLSLVCQYKTPIVLIDDIDAELDSQSKNRLLSVLTSLPCQIVITSLNTQLITQLPARLCCFSIQNGSISV